MAKFHPSKEATAPVCWTLPSSFRSACLPDAFLDSQVRPFIPWHEIYHLSGQHLKGPQSCTKWSSTAHAGYTDDDDYVWKQYFVPRFLKNYLNRLVYFSLCFSYVPLTTRVTASGVVLWPLVLCLMYQERLPNPPSKARSTQQASKSAGVSGILWGNLSCWNISVLMHCNSLHNLAWTILRVHTPNIS